MLWRKKAMKRADTVWTNVLEEKNPFIEKLDTSKCTHTSVTKKLPHFICEKQQRLVVLAVR